MREAFVGLLERLRTRGELFLERLQTDLRAGVGFGVAARDLHLIAGVGRCGRLFDLRHDAAGALLLRLRWLRGCAAAGGRRQPAPVGLEVGRLRTQFAPGLARIDCPDRVGSGNAEHRARAQAVDVAAVEGLRIGAQQRDQRLVERCTGVRIGTGDAVHRVATAHGIGVGDGARRGRGAGRHRRPRHRARGRRGRRRVDGRCERTRRCQIDRIEQEGVFAQQAPGGPVQLDQQVDEGVVDRAVAGQPDDGTGGPRIDTDANGAGCTAIGQVCLTKRLGGCDPRAERLQFLRRRADLDLRAQRLTEAAIDVDLPQTRRLRGERKGGNR